MTKHIAVLAVGFILGGAVATVWGSGDQSGAPSIGTPYQAVLLDTGQVYYGKIEGLGTPYPVLREVYYIQNATDPNTQQVTNVLIRRGQEWHGPDFTVLDAGHIALIEPINPNSKVAQLIAEQQTKTPQP